MNHALDSETQKSKLYLLRGWIFFFIYDPFMEVPVETLNLSMDLEIRIAFQNLTTAAKKKIGKKNFYFSLFPGITKIPEKSLVLLPAFCTNVGRRAEIA